MHLIEETARHAGLLDVVEQQRPQFMHLIEETARHAGHADFLREAIDGAVGE